MLVHQTDAGGILHQHTPERLHDGGFVGGRDISKRHGFVRTNPRIVPLYDYEWEVFECHLAGAPGDVADPSFFGEGVDHLIGVRHRPCGGIPIEVADPIEPGVLEELWVLLHQLIH